MVSILLEKYLASQFKFGFELEAFLKEGWLAEDHEEDIKLNIEEDISAAFKISEKEAHIKYDGSLNPDDNDDYAFEWATPTMNFTPENIKKCIFGLDYLMKSGYYTNETCGFHVHLSFPNISDMDSIWLISHLALDRELIYKLTSFEGLDFYNDEYASLDFLYDIRDKIENEDFSSLQQDFSTEKYRAFHIHPQGTIEWRGPRDFLDYYNIKSVFNFFKLLHEFVMWISKTIVKKDINGISKNTYMKLIYGKDYKEGELISNFNEENKNKLFIDKIRKDILNNNPKFFINLLKRYKKTNDENIKELLIKYILYFYHTDDVIKPSFYNNLLNSLFDMNLYDIFYKIISFRINFFENSFRSASSENLYKILEYLYSQQLGARIIHILSNVTKNDNVSGAQKFILNYQDKISDLVWNKLFSYPENIATYSSYITRPSLIDKKQLFNSIIGSLLRASLVNKSLKGKDIAEFMQHDYVLESIYKIIKQSYKNDILNQEIKYVFNEVLNNLKNNIGNKDNEYYEKYVNAYELGQKIYTLLK